MDFEVEHFAVSRNAQSSSVDSIFDTVAELQLMSEAACLMTSNSGFSNIAQFWGGRTCVSTVAACA